MDQDDKTIKQYLEWEKGLPQVPGELVDNAKRLMPGKDKLNCPHCGKPITPFKKPLGKQRLFNLLWLVLSAAAFGLSFVFHRYFLQFLAFGTIFAFKWVLDQKATKTQILIYKALQEESPTHQRHLHDVSSDL